MRASPRPPPMRARSPRQDGGAGAYPQPVGQIRSTRLEPLPLPRLPESQGQALEPQRPLLPRNPPAPRPGAASTRGGAAGRRGAGSGGMSPSVLLGLSHAAAAVRELNWNKLYLALDVVIRYLVPCECFSLYLVEERGRYLRRINPYAEAFPPERRGHPVEAVSEATMEGNASINVEPCSLPSQTRYAHDWATREACALHPFPGLPGPEDVAAGHLRRWFADSGLDGGRRSAGTAVERVHNVLAFPIRFGAGEQDDEDAFAEYSSADSQVLGADETVFGVIKLTNRIDMRPKNKKLQIRPLQTSGRRVRDDNQYKLFSEADLRVLSGLSSLLREIYFAIDPLTFGPRVEPSLDLERSADDEPLNMPSVQGRSAITSRSLPAGSRMLEGAGKGGGGLFGVLGSAFAKTSAQRRRAPELGNLVSRPDITVTSDSTESMRSAPGWIHQEWTDGDAECIAAERARPGQRRIGGITLMATWRLREDALVDPYCTICRFQLRVRRLSHVRQGQQLWRALPPFFCIEPDEVTKQYCSFVTEYISYAEEYTVSVRAGSADRWSEWSEQSEPILFQACPLQPQDGRVQLACEFLEPREAPSDPLQPREHSICFRWPAFESFDPRTALPVEYLVEAWQREDRLGAATRDQVLIHARAAGAVGSAQVGIHDLLPGAGLEWVGARQLPLATLVTEALVGDPLELVVDLRTTALAAESEVYFAVRARYMSLPGVASWSEAALFSKKALVIPTDRPCLPAPIPVCAEEFSTESPADAVVVQWPFASPSSFCSSDAQSDGTWNRGPYSSSAALDDFPQPFRLQYRAVSANGETSPWRESETYEFVSRRVPDRAESQVAPSADGRNLADARCLRENFWGLRAAGLRPAGGAFLPGLVETRWVSTALEGLSSAASAVMCTNVTPLRKPPHVRHVIVNCSSGSTRGRDVQMIGQQDKGALYELRHVARLTWDMDRNAPSFAFVVAFAVRYREAAPGASLAKATWIELPPTPMTSAVDSSQDQGSCASFTFDLSSEHLSRHHTYEFSIQVRSREHTSAWSPASEPWLLDLPQLVPSGAIGSEEGIQGPGPVEGSGRWALDRTVDAQCLELKSERERPMRSLLEATVRCDGRDASQWDVALKWCPFRCAGDCLVMHPELKTLPVEFEVRYQVLTDRPCAADVTKATEAQRDHLNAMENASEYVGAICSQDDDDLTQQRGTAIVCGEGSVSAHEEVVMRSIERHRLPPMRCDVRLFVVCRCPAVTGPDWSKEALMVDVSLPRLSPLPLPVPRQLSCMELQARGLAPDMGCAEVGENVSPPYDGLCATLAIPTFCSEFVLCGQDDHGEDGDLFFHDEKDEATAHVSRRNHYVLQFRVHDPLSIQRCGAGRHPLTEEHEWHTVRSVQCLLEAQEESVYLAHGFKGIESSDNDRINFVTFRLASFKNSHHSYGSAAACVSVLPAPSKPRPTVDWVDSPSICGACVRLAVKSCPLSQSYQLRYRLSSEDPTKASSWTVCEAQEIQRSGPCVANDELLPVEALAPIEWLSYHSEYAFSIRTASQTRFSAWSEDSEFVRLSLEHHGMRPSPDVSKQEVGDEEQRGLRVELLGLDERHNYRCPAVDFQWPPLTFPEGVWGPDSVFPAPALTIEYRVRLRRQIVEHNDRVALGAVVEEVAAEHRSGDPDTREEGGVRLLSPDPDRTNRDIAERGYMGDETKRPHDTNEYTPWQIVAIVPATASGPTASTICASACCFLNAGFDYEVAVDWRWRRLGDPFWMLAYGPLRFTTKRPTPPPPLPLQMPLPPEAWDYCLELQKAFGSGDALLLQWPFASLPRSDLAIAPRKKCLEDEARIDPLGHGEYALQCRPKGCKDWTTCEASFLRIHGKPLCYVSQLPPEEVLCAGDMSESDSLVPKPAETLELAQNEIGDDEMEFRTIRAGDCEVSLGIPCSIAGLPAPESVVCKLKLLPPHSTLVASVRFRSAVALGCASAPTAFQIRVDAIHPLDDSDKVRLLPPVPLPLERLPEAFGALRTHSLYLGNAEEPQNREELGSLATLARGGGEDRLLMSTREFEHLLSFQHLMYGRDYKVRVRWLSIWRVSDWTAPIDLSVRLSPPRTGEGPCARTIDIKVLEPTVLPPNACGDDGFLPPIVAHRVKLSWDPFRLELWGGGRMEYEVQRRCMLWDRSTMVSNCSEEDVDTTAWDVVGRVTTSIEDATGIGVDTEEIAAIVTSPQISEEAEQTGAVEDSVQNSRADANSASGVEADDAERRSQIAAEGIEADDAEKRSQIAAEESWEEYEAEYEEESAEDASGQSFGKPGVSGSIELESEKHAVQETPSAAVEEEDPRRIHFIAGEMQLSAVYQFRIRARLCFHPNAEHEGEWSEFVESPWHRTRDEVPEPTSPCEAIFPVPPPAELLEDGSTLLKFGLLPNRSGETRSEDCPPPPAPFQLQFRGAMDSENSDWHIVKSKPLDENRFVVSDPRLMQYLETGAIFRLWRCRHPPGRDQDSPQRPEEDRRPRHYAGLVSRPSAPLRVAPPRFLDAPSVRLTLGEVAVSEPAASASFETRPLHAQVRWRVLVPGNAALEAVRLYQVRYRLVSKRPDPRLVLSKEATAALAAEGEWRELEALEQETSSSANETVHDLPIVRPCFFMGFAYDVSVRIGTRWRWGQWSPEVRFDLAVQPPEPSEESRVTAELVTLIDGTHFFKIRWPSFRPHHLCTQVEYRIRMIRRTRYKYRTRLAPEMAERSAEAFAAQEETHLIGCVRRKVPRAPGPIDADWEAPPETVEFMHTVAAHPDCGYCFAVDARHEHIDEHEDANEEAVWSKAIWSTETVTPPHWKNWFTPSQVPLELLPAGLQKDGIRAAFPLRVSEHACSRWGLGDPREASLLLFAPWRTSAEASYWPHRVEYAPYIPRANAVRDPIPQDGSEHDVDWYLPDSVEYVSEDYIAGGATVGAHASTALVVIRGFEASAWDREREQLGVSEPVSELGRFLRIRVVREGGPEGLEAFSSPSPPMRLTMPPVERPPSVAVWSVNARLRAAIWWPCRAALLGQDDKNISMAGQVHQFRMRRPKYPGGTEWLEGPVRTTPVPALLPIDGTAGEHELQAFDWCAPFDDSAMPEELVTTVLPKQPTGPAPDAAVLTYEFCVRTGDGYRWSDWSQPSEPISFALEPTLTKDPPVDVVRLGNLLREPPMTGGVAAAAVPLTEASESLDKVRGQDGAPPTWIAVSHAPRPGYPPLERDTPTDVVFDAQQAVFVASWPGLPPQAYLQPDPASAKALQPVLDAGLLPAFRPPAVVYRLNVWLVASASDAAPLTDSPPASQSGASDGPVLYRQYDLPPTAFPDPSHEMDGLAAPRMLSWVLRDLLPDRIFRCTVEGRFQNLPSVEWWTPLMCSNEFTIPRVPPPPEPVQLPICQLPTPEYTKLLERRSLGSSAVVAVRWPWPLSRTAAEALRTAPYALEFCGSSVRPGLRDPSSAVGFTAETASNRASGPWKQAQASQLLFANFEANVVSEELPPEAHDEQHWHPVLVISGLRPQVPGWAAAPPSEDSPEAPFVHVRWRYRAPPREMATVPVSLHFSPASGPMRTKVVSPSAPPKWYLEAQHRRICARLLWTGWQDASTHQFAFRILGPQKNRKRKLKSRRSRMDTLRSQASVSALSDDGDAASTSGTDMEPQLTAASSAMQPTASQADPTAFHVPLTGWIELPPTAEDVERKLPTNDCEYDRSPRSPSKVEVPTEDFLVAEFMRRVPAQEWNSMLFRNYRDQPEFFVEGQQYASDSESTAVGASQFGTAIGTAIGSTAESRVLSRSHTPRTDVGTPVDSDSRASTPRGSRSDFSESRFGAVRSTRSVRSNKSTRGAPNVFRLRFGMQVEWRVRLSDGNLWSMWSPPSSPSGIVPPMPIFTTEVHIDYSQRQPMNARITWGGCRLPANYEHLSKTIEYIVYVTTSEEAARAKLQAGVDGFFTERMHRVGIELSDGTCGILNDYDGEGFSGSGRLNLEDYFATRSENRLIGKFSHHNAKWINFKGGEDAQSVMGFEVNVSGLKPESVHRVSVRARCVTGGLDEPDWQNLRVDPNHPLRWSDAVHSKSVLTPAHAPPLLVPEPVPIPDGRFARFRHTPCLLLKSAVFRKLHADDFDKQHPVVLDVKRAGAMDTEYTQVSLDNSVYCEVEPYGPCRLIHGLQFLHVELRARNTMMNDISAACPPVFALPPLPLESTQGPKVKLNVSECGELFVTLTWTTRCLPKQELSLVQLGLRRHSVESPFVDMEAFAVTDALLAEELPPNALLAGGQAYDDAAAAALSAAAAAAEAEGRGGAGAGGASGCPFLCRQCFLPLDIASVPSAQSLGPHGQARLADVAAALAEGTVPVGEVPAYRGGEDLLQGLRSPHVVEQKAADRGGQHASQPRLARKATGACGCRDVVFTKTLPVDGKTICYGTIYRFRVRMRDKLNWSQWTEFSVPVHIVVAPPRLALPLKDPMNPAPPPTVEIEPVVSAGDQELRGVSGQRVRLCLRWPRFEGLVRDVEYRVLMWTLSPEQRKRAAATGRLPDATTSRNAGLPPIIGRQTFTAEVPICLGKDASTQPPLAVVSPRTSVPGNAGAGAGASGTQAGRAGVVPVSSDAPQLIAHLRPFEPPARGRSSAKAPKQAAPGEPDDVLPNELERALKTLSVEVRAEPLPEDHGYVFAVEAKYAKGACGNLSEWSAPLFSRCLGFENKPVHLSLEVEGRFGALLFKGAATTAARPTNEQVALDAAAISYVDEHRDMSGAVPLLPKEDTWPVGSPSLPGRYVVRAKGRHLHSERLARGGDAGSEAPERAPRGDEVRESDARHLR